MVNYNPQKYWLRVTILFLISMSFFSGADARNSKKPDSKSEYVLILNSINFNLAWSKSIYWEVREAMVTDGVDVKSESLGIPGLRTMDEMRNIVKFIREKYTETPLAVLCIGDPAWMVCRELFDDVWKDVPVIISDSHEWLPATIEKLVEQAPMTAENIVPESHWHKGYNLTTITPSFQIKETVNLMRQLIPDLNKIAFISDARYVSAVARNEMNKVMSEEFPQLIFSQLSSLELSTEAMLDSLSIYEKNTGIIYFSWFEAIAKHDNSYFIDHIQEVINNFAKSPIFLIATQDLTTNNYAGGFYVDPKVYGKSIVKLLERIRKGESPKDIPPSVGGVPKSYLSYPYLVSKGISTTLFPKDAIYINPPHNFFNQYKREIFIVSIIVFIIIALTIFYIYILNKEKLLKESENRALKLNDHVFKTIKEPVCWVSKDGLILKILNNPDQKYLSLSPDDAIGQHVTRYIPNTEEQELHQKMVIDTLRTKNSNRLKLHLCNLENEYFWIFVSMIFYDDDKVICFLQDISDIERERIRGEKLNDELLRAKEQAEESNRLKSAFIANMSHEIRTPLNAIVGFSDLLNEAENENDRREYVKIIQHNNELLLRLINDVLDLSKIEAGALDLCFSNTDIHLMMNDIYQSTLLRQDNTQVNIIMDAYEGEYFIYTDYSRIEQVLLNFMTNAMKFTQKGEIHLGYKLLCDEKIMFYVTDTGCGLSVSEQQIVFDRFVKFNSFVQGTGIGLTICKLIIEKLEGEIGVKSTPEQGSTFWFTLPLSNR